MKHYDEASCLNSLRRKRTIKITNGVILVERDATEVGNGSWGKIDYLCKYCGYRWTFVDAVIKNNNKKKHNESYDTESDNVPQNNKNKFSVSKLIRKFKK